MRHQGISEDVFAPGHFTLCGTGAQAHPKGVGGGGRSGFEVILILGDYVLSLSLLLAWSNTPRSHGNTELTLTTGLAGRRPCHRCSCHHIQSVHLAAQSQSRRC